MKPSDERARVLTREDPDEVEVHIDAAPIIWPAEGTIRAGEGSNRTFEDFSGAQWGDVDEIIEIEAEALRDCMRDAPAPDVFWDRAHDHADDLYADYGITLDFGLAAAVLALNAARCPTRMSCNGHGREPAYIDFWTRPERAPLLAEAARAAGVGLCNCEEGGMVVYSDEADGLHRFAAELRARSGAFRRVHAPRRTRAAGRPRRRSGADDSPRQLELALATRT